MITTDSFLYLCKQIGLSYEDVEQNSIGLCIDLIDEYIERQKPEKEKVRKAKQTDFDSF